MSINFGQVRSSLSTTAFVDPRQLFSSLPGKSAKYAYLRDVQAEVLEQWHDRRAQKDLRLKMNTGGGKTVVGLLVLKSSLNEGAGPAVYVAPTPYLAKQVMEEAAALGIEAVDDPKSLAVQRGSAVLITNIHVLLNGKSKFGVGDEGVKIPIGSLVLDDAHACLAAAEQQFTMSLDSDHGVYKKLLQLFAADLEAQSQAGYMDVLHGDPHKIMQVPFWAWQARIREVRDILYAAKEEDGVKFARPLLNPDLHLTRCVFGNKKVEVSPRCLPIRQIPSFAEAKRRVFMSATFADDSILVSHFDTSDEDIRVAVAPKSASDLGERMILVPQELTPKITDDEIKAQAVAWAEKHNVVVIVPSSARAEYWREGAALVTGADGLEKAVSSLRRGHLGLVVVVNKYDGIDLPDGACRVLILDGLPDVRRLVDRLDEACLKNTELAVGKAIQQLEQGMGRGVRSNSDYCAVVLMGRSLVGNLFVEGGIGQLTPATRAQFNLSESVGKQVRGKPMPNIAEAFEACLSRNSEWVSLAKDVLASATYATESGDLSMAVARRGAWDVASDGDPGGAEPILTPLANAQTDSRVQGWVLAEAAEYENLVDKEAAQKLLKSGSLKNKQLPLRPLGGIEYIRINSVTGEQAAASLKHIRQNYRDANAAIIAAHAIAEDLVYRPDSYKRFERALADAAPFLGFSAQMPEDEYGKGPDVLWALGNLQYLVIECKNEASVETVSKTYANQLAGSANWFAEKYDASCSGAPLLFHPSRKFEHAATPAPGARIVTAAKMGAFREAFAEFCVALAGHHASGTHQDAAALLARYKFVPKDMLLSYTEAPLRS